MSLFKEKKTYPHLPEGDYEVVLRCSICNGEQVICLKDRHTGELRDLLLVQTKADLEGFCRENKISSADIGKVY